MAILVAEDAVDEHEDAQYHESHHQLILEVVEVSIVLDDALDFGAGVFVVVLLLIFYDFGVVAGDIISRELFAEKELHQPETTV